MKAAIVRVRRQYNQAEITHTVIEGGEDQSIRIEMPLEPFIQSLVSRVIEGALIDAGSPFVLTRAKLAARINANLPARIEEAINVEVQKMKDSTVYKANA